MRELLIGYLLAFGTRSWDEYKAMDDKTLLAHYNLTRDQQNNNLKM
jgi:hypothetical protein